MATLTAGFVFDDHVLIVRNESLRAAAELPGYFTRGTWPRSTIGVADTATYRPLVLVAFFAIYQAAGAAPAAFHAVNVALHAVNAVLVFLLLRRVGVGNMVPTVVGAVVFAVHPVHVESVAWVSGITDVLMTSCVLLTLWLYAAPSRWAYAGALLSSALAMFSKEPAVVLPLLALTHDALLLRRVRWPRVAGLAAVTVFYLGARRVALGATMHAPSLSIDAFGRAIDYFLGYVDLTVAPVAAGLFLTPPARAVGALGAVTAVAIVAGVAVWSRRDRVAAFGVVLFVATLAPALSLVFNAGTTYAQRFLYLPSVAVSLLVARLPLERWRRASAAAAVVIVALAAVSLVGTRPWRDDGLILEQAVRNTPEFHGGYASLGLYYEGAGRRDDAARMYLEAARLAPPAQRALAYNRLGMMYFAAADYARAAPAFETAWDLDRTRWDALYNLGVTLVRLGRDDEARTRFVVFDRGAPREKYAAALAEVRWRLAH